MPAFAFNPVARPALQGRSAAQMSPATAVLRSRGLPTNTPAAIQATSGVHVTGVRVHHASARDIALASGEERALPHEAWHVVQRRRDQVRPSGATGTLPPADHPSLEHEAMRTGARASMQMADLAATSVPRAMSTPAGAHEPSPVLQLVGISPATWRDAETVTELKHGVYKVAGPGGDVVFKLSQDTADPADEAVAAQFGAYLSVETIKPELFRTSEVSAQLAHLGGLGKPGGDLVNLAAQTKTFLVMPFVEGKDLIDAQQDVAKASADEQRRWGEQLGRMFIFDVLISNTDRAGGNGGNIRLGADGKLYALDQAVGATASKEFESILAETMGSRLSDKKAQQFLSNIFPALGKPPQPLREGFDRGMMEARKLAAAVPGDTTLALYRLVSRTRFEVDPKPGVALAISEFARLLANEATNASRGEGSSTLVSDAPRQETTSSGD